ncbi:hypothetical protein SXM_3976 [Shewanella xiamenensis]|nr:hypothetical protein [Shewanella xiamenensis]KEK26506.1 hypothetical protein SXM_3976 [Shewanella xiamenensis]
MTTTLLSLLTFFLGLILGHWLSIGRDKRKEFNEAVIPVRAWLLREKESPNPYSRLPSEEELDIFIHYLRPWQRGVFLKHLKSYKELHHSLRVQDSYGGISYQSDTAIRQELNKLFSYTGRK